jgi:hypothetical protein
VTVNPAFNNGGPWREPIAVASPYGVHVDRDWLVVSGPEVGPVDVPTRVVQARSSYDGVTARLELSVHGEPADETMVTTGTAFRALAEAINRMSADGRAEESRSDRSDRVGLHRSNGAHDVEAREPMPEPIAWPAEPEPVEPPAPPEPPKVIRGPDLVPDGKQWLMLEPLYDTYVLSRGQLFLVDGVVPGGDVQ